MTGNTDGLSVTPSSFSGYPNRPVEQVSWDDMQVFLGSIKHQQSANMPAVGSMSRAYRVQGNMPALGTTTVYILVGNDINSSLANYNWTDFGMMEMILKRLGCWPICTKPMGFYDMQGNVLEYSGLVSTNYLIGPVDPSGPETGSTEVYVVDFGGVDGVNLRSATRWGVTLR